MKVEDSEGLKSHFSLFLLSPCLAHLSSRTLLSDEREIRMSVFKAYEGFLVENASQITAVESSLRTLTYFLPGRFKDAELAGEASEYIQDEIDEVKDGG